MSIKSIFHKWAYSQPTLNKPYASLKVALVCDSLTESALKAECRTKPLTPSNYNSVLKKWRPDLVFVESAWNGHRQSWKYKLASYPDYPERNNYELERLVASAKQLNIPLVFWNKEDSTHYERFIGSARLFDYIFTVDSNCLQQYAQHAPGARAVQVLPFPVQSSFHNTNIRRKKDLGYSCFIGSYSTHIHPRRQQWQNMLFEVFASKGLVIYDRNSHRRAKHYRYPLLQGMKIRKAVAYQTTAEIYKSYKYNLNVNTVEDSPTMYSRRLIEILAVGGVAISTPSLAVSTLFGEFCYTVSEKKELECLLLELDGNYKKALERAFNGAEIIAQQHTWTNRLTQIQDCVGF